MTKKEEWQERALLAERNAALLGMALDDQLRRETKWLATQEADGWNYDAYVGGLDQPHGGYIMIVGYTVEKRPHAAVYYLDDFAAFERDVLRRNPASKTSALFVYFASLAEGLRSKTEQRAATPHSPGGHHDHRDNQAQDDHAH